MLHVIMNKSHVNIIRLHIDRNTGKSHTNIGMLPVHMIMLHVYIIYLEFRGQGYVRIIQYICTVEYKNCNIMMAYSCAPPPCKMNYVDMHHSSVDMQTIHVNMRLIYGNMPLYLAWASIQYSSNLI